MDPDGGPEGPPLRTRRQADLKVRLYGRCQVGYILKYQVAYILK